MQDCRHVWAGLLPQNSTEHGRDNKELMLCVLPRSMRCASVVGHTRAVKATRFHMALPKRTAAEATVENRIYPNR